MKITLFWPMVSMVGLTFFVYTVLFLIRLHAVRTGIVRMRYYRNMTDGKPSDLMINAARHLNNLFEAPILFYLVCVLAMVVGIESRVMVSLAWAFVGARIAHAIFHILYNRVMLRFCAFLTGLAILGVMWIELAMAWRSVVANP